MIVDRLSNLSSMIPATPKSQSCTPPCSVIRTFAPWQHQQKLNGTAGRAIRERLTLDIPMDNTSLMNPFKSLGNLSQDRNDPFLHQACWSRRFHLGAD
jgi:hypothetical protein